MTSELNNLARLLNKPHLFDQEAYVVYFMVELRKLLDREKPKEMFTLIRFYADWTVHTSKDRYIEQIKPVIQRIASQVPIAKYESYMPAFKLSILDFVELQSELRLLLVEYELNTRIVEESPTWKQFINTLCSVLVDQPLILHSPIECIKSVVFQQTVPSMRYIQIEFADIRGTIRYIEND